MSVGAGIDMILVADTYGTSSPSAMRYFVKELKRYTNVPLGIHCHDDLGLALANTLAAVERRSRNGGSIDKWTGRSDWELLS